MLNGVFKLFGMFMVVVDGYRLFTSVRSELILDSVNVVDDDDSALRSVCRPASK